MVARPPVPLAARSSGARESRTSQRPSSAGDYNLRIVWGLARYVEERFGADALREVSAAGALTPADFGGHNRWVTWESFEAVLARSRALMADDGEFKRACAHRIKEGYGPLRYILWATTPAQVFAQASKQYPLVSRCGHVTVKGRGRTGAHITFRSDVPYSRLVCLVRHAQAETMPTMWGLPPAHTRETKCIAWGDDECEMDLYWYEARRWLPIVLGAVLFAALGYLLVHFGLATVPTPVALGMMGALLGYVAEARRTDRLNRGTREEVMGALQQLAHEEADARHELLEMHARQKEWTRLVEDEMGARTAAFQKLAGGVTALHEARATALLGVSHDLRNPLQIIQMSSEFLRSSAGVAVDVDATESVRDIDTAVERMRRMLGDLVQVTKAQRDFVTMAPQTVQSSELTESLRRRLRALVHGREVRATVFATREAPEHVVIDPLALDRIVDNLLTNAAKYTERGSIVVEIDGSPGFLVLKVSDTGRGIAQDALERIFEAGGSSLESRRGDSFGVGLSVVVQLLDQMGGRIEIMSKPGSGTTFWVYLPVAGKADDAGDPARVVSESAVVKTSVAPLPAMGAFAGPNARSRVVSIRRLPA